MGYRSEELRDVVESFLAYHDEWATDDNKPVPDGRYWDLADDVIAAFDDGSIPADCRELAEAVEAFTDEVSVFDNRDNPAEAYPHAAFWTAVGKVRKCIESAKGPTLRPLESLQTLREQKVTDMQICTIYGFFDRKGNAMPWLVQQELDKPGSILQAPGAIDGRDWHDPRVPPNQKATDDADESDRAVTRKTKAAEREAAPCPETPHELFQQGVSIAQAARMLRQEESVIAGMWADFEAEKKQHDEQRELAKAQDLLNKGKKKAGV